jgi:hypothetical protein
VVSAAEQSCTVGRQIRRSTIGNDRRLSGPAWLNHQSIQEESVTMSPSEGLIEASERTSVSERFPNALYYISLLLLLSVENQVLFFSTG